MASTHPDPEDRPFPVPWEDDDTPGVSIHPLSHADIEAILASPHGRGARPQPPLPARPAPALASPAGCTPRAVDGTHGPHRQQRSQPGWAAGRVRPGRIPAPPRGRAHHLDPHPALAGARHPGRRCGRLAGRHPAQPAPARPRPADRRRARRRLVAAAVPPQPRDPSLAARRRRGAPPRPPGYPRLDGAARPGRPPLHGEHRSSGHRHPRGVRDRRQALPRPPAPVPRRAALARPLPPWPPP